MTIPKFHSPDEEYLPLIPEDAVPISGTSRDVYQILGHPDKVLKVAKNSNSANWTEFVVWRNLDDQSYFGEIYSISASGKYLVMELLKDLSGADPLPDVLPFMTDTKKNAFGKTVNGEVKVRDYGLIKLSAQHRITRFS